VYPILLFLARISVALLQFHALYFLAVFADSLNALAVGAPLSPGFRIRSLDPDFILARFAMML
jgi:hypothetical protein